MQEIDFPPGWDEQRVRKVLKHYESQSEEAALAEGEATDPKKQQTGSGPELREQPKP